MLSVFIVWVDYEGATTVPTTEHEAGRIEAVIKIGQKAAKPEWRQQKNYEKKGEDTN